MPTSILGSLYGLVAEAEPILRAEIILTTSPIPAGTNIAYGSLAQPNVRGYAPVVGATMADLFPSPEVVTNKAALLVSRQLDWRNEDAGDVEIKGLALVVWKDVGSPYVVTAIAAPVTWARGMRIGGRLRVTSNIYTEP